MASSSRFAIASEPTAAIDDAASLPEERPLGRLNGPSVPVPSPTVLRSPEGLHRRELPLSDESDPSPNLSRTTCSQSLVAQFLQRCSSSY